MAKLTNYDYCHHNNLEISDIVSLKEANCYKTIDEFLKGKCFYHPKFKRGDIIAYHGDRRKEDRITINERSERSENVVPENVYVVCRYNESSFDYTVREINGLGSINWASLIEFGKVRGDSVILNGDRVKASLIDFGYTIIGHLDI